jgi:transcriptional regulator with XRE-family HTH domain
MSAILTPTDVEALAAKAGKTMMQVCKEANIAPSTFSRWKRGETSPSLKVYEKIMQAAAAEERASA